MRCGLLGQTLAHSHSPLLHSLLGDYAYTLFEKAPDQVEDFLKNGSWDGLNVTIPYKKTAYALCDSLSPIARETGNVNTLLRRRDGSIFGDNTDAFGFESLLRHASLDPKGKKCLVLGSGGASNTVTAVLAELGAETMVISRSGENNYGNLQRHEDAAAIVNATPVGMYPNTGVSPVDLKRFPKLEGVLDVIYNPARTQLLLDAEALHIPCANGLWMLVAQAKESAEYFTGKSIDDAVIAKIYGTLAAQMANIVLIGMPGCGKSTVGTPLADKLGRNLVDADEEIICLAGKSIPAIFAEDGEAVFRDWETKALSQLGKQSALVIATGGGCVTQPRNYPMLHQNGVIFWLKRDISKLPTDGRPLSQANPLDSMFAKRAPMYAAFADHAVSNDGTAEETVAAILSIMEEPI